MKKKLIQLVSLLGFAVVTAIPAAGADDLATLAGKWSVNKTNEEGKFTQQIEIKKDKFTFKIMSPEGEVRLYAEGDVKLDKAGPFKTVIFTNIKAGGSADDSSPIDDTFTSIYKIADDDTWLVVMNFDKERDEMQKPSLDVYHKVKEIKK